MNGWTQTKSVTIKVTDEAWIKRDQVAAVTLGDLGVRVHLVGGEVILLDVEPTGAELDRVAKALCADRESDK